MCLSPAKRVVLMAFRACWNYDDCHIQTSAQPAVGQGRRRTAGKTERGPCHFPGPGAAGNQRWWGTRAPPSFPAAQGHRPCAQGDDPAQRGPVRLSCRRQRYMTEPTRQRERTMRRFKSAGHAQRFVSAFGPIREHFCPRRHRLRADEYRREWARRFRIWSEVTGLQMAA